MPDGRLDEVISVVARRRRWTLEQKLALVEEVSRPGASVAAVANRHGMSRSLLFEWRRQVRDGTMPGVARADVTATLVPVRIVEDDRDGISWADTGGGSGASSDTATCAKAGSGIGTAPSSPLISCRRHV